jgi:hypothetical protein
MKGLCFDGEMSRNGAGGVGRVIVRGNASMDALAIGHAARSQPHITHARTLRDYAARTNPGQGGADTGIFSALKFQTAWRRAVIRRDSD